MIVILAIIFVIPCAMLAYLFFVIGGLGSSGGGPELPAPTRRQASGPSITQRELVRARLGAARSEWKQQDAATAAWRSGEEQRMSAGIANAANPRQREAMERSRDSTRAEWARDDASEGRYRVGAEADIRAGIA